MFHTWQSFNPVNKRYELFNWLTCMERTLNGTFKVFNLFQVNFFFVGLSFETFVFITLWLVEEERIEKIDVDHRLSVFLLADDQIFFTSSLHRTKVSIRSTRFSRLKISSSSSPRDDWRDSKKRRVGRSIHLFLRTGLTHQPSLSVSQCSLVVRLLSFRTRRRTSRSWRRRSRDLCDRHRQRSERCRLARSSCPNDNETNWSSSPRDVSTRRECRSDRREDQHCPREYSIGTLRRVVCLSLREHSPRRLTSVSFSWSMSAYDEQQLNDLRETQGEFRRQLSETRRSGQRCFFADKFPSRTECKRHALLVYVDAWLRDSTDRGRYPTILRRRSSDAFAVPLLKSNCSTRYVENEG